MGRARGAIGTPTPSSPQTIKVEKDLDALKQEATRLSSALEDIQQHIEKLEKT